MQSVKSVSKDLCIFYGELMSTHDDLLNELNQRREQINQGGGAARIEAQHAKGKRTAREGHGIGMPWLRVVNDP